MDNYHLNLAFSSLSTPLISDACLRLEISLRLAPAGISLLIAESHIAGRVLPVRHYGSVDIFLEAMGLCRDGDILAIDNNGRMDEGCIGNLMNIWRNITIIRDIHSESICERLEALLKNNKYRRKYD